MTVLSVVTSGVGSLASVVFVKGSLLILLAVLATTLLRSFSAATRSACWTALGIALLVLPLVSALVPRVAVGIPAAAVLGSREPMVVSVQADAPAERQKSVLDRWVPWMPVAFASVWLAGCGLLLAGLARGLSRVRAIRLRATPIDDEWAALTARAIADSFGVRRRVRLSVSRDVDVPVTGGLFRPFIILPVASGDWTRRWSSAVMVHELAHVARWDYGGHLLFEVVRAVYWPNPFIWRAMTRATTERELAADDRVILTGTCRAEYATGLLAFATAALEPATARAVMGLAPSAFRVRMRAILQDGVNRRLPTRRDVGIIGMVAALVLSSVASLSAGPDCECPVTPNAATFGGVAAPRERLAVVSRIPHPRSRRVGLDDARQDSLLTTLLRDSVPELRVIAARELRLVGAQGNAVRVLVSALSDTCHADRWRAARALRDLRAGRALPGLVHQLVADEHSAVRSMAANAIATSGVTQGAALLRAALVGAPLDQFARVARAIDTLGGTPAYERLLKAMHAARRT